MVRTVHMNIFYKIDLQNTDPKIKFFPNSGAVRVLVGFNRLSISPRIVRLRVDSAAERVAVHVSSGSRGTNSWCEVLAVLIRSTKLLTVLIRTARSHY